MKTVRPNPGILQSLAFRQMNIPPAWVLPGRVWRWLPRSEWLPTGPSSAVHGRVLYQCRCRTACSNCPSGTCGRTVSMSYRGYATNNIPTKLIDMYAEACPACGTIYWTTITRRAYP